MWIKLLVGVPLSGVSVAVAATICAIPIVLFVRFILLTTGESLLRLRRVLTRRHMYRLSGWLARNLFLVVLLAVVAISAIVFPPVILGSILRRTLGLSLEIALALAVPSLMALVLTFASLPWILRHFRDYVAVTAEAAEISIKTAQRRVCALVATAAIHELIAPTIMFAWMIGSGAALFAAARLSPDVDAVALIVWLVTTGALYLVIPPLLRALLRRTPEVKLLFAVDRALTGWRRHSDTGRWLLGARPSDPLSTTRVAVLDVAFWMAVYADGKDRRFGGGFTNPVCALYRAGAEYLFRFAQSAESLVEELPPHVVESVRNALVLTIYPSQHVCRFAADMWSAFDEDGQPSYRYDPPRLTRLREFLLGIGRGVEPMGRGIQVMVTCALAITTIVFIVIGKINLLDLINKFVH